MASTGGDSDTSSLGSSSSSSSPSAEADAGAQNHVNLLAEAQHDQQNPTQETRSVSAGDDEDQDSEDYDRENRFQGGASTWRYFTENERSLAKSLDQQRANDLSIALYNVHALKARVRDPEAAAKVKPYHSKKRWIKPNKDDTLPWQPSTRWTAWPLRPGRVPMPGERFGVLPIPDGFGEETYRKTEPWKPSADVEEAILAIAMRKAKERLRASGSRDRSTQVEGVEMAKQPPIEESHGSADHGSDADVSMAGESDDSVEILSARQRIKSAPAFPLDENLLVDDDAARTLLQPKLRHLLSQLDGLLMGLHKSRQGQIRTNSRSRSRIRRSRSTSRAAKSSSRSKSRQRKPSNASSDDISNDKEAETGEADEVVESNDTKPKRRRRLKPRDWSEVLGMAAFTGFDPRVVDRAAKRCAALFGEGMDFKTVPLNSMTSTKSKTRTYGSGIDRPTATAGGHRFVVEDNPSVNWCYCPVTTCARHEEPFEQAWRWREHMKRSHKYSKARLETLKAKLSKKDAAASTTAGQQEAARVPIQAGVDRHAGAANKDPLLQPIVVRMGRGKDKQARERKASQPVLTRSENEADVEMKE